VIGFEISLDLDNQLSTSPKYVISIALSVTKEARASKLVSLEFIDLLISQSNVVRCSLVIQVISK